MLSLISGLLKPVFGIIDKAIPDKSLRDQLKHDIQSQLLNNETALAKAASTIIVAEAQGESWMQRNWRPSLMFLIMGLLVFNGVMVPLVEVFFAVDLPILEAWKAIPSQMWTLLQIGLGGYIVGRSGEKIAKTWKPSE